MACQRKRFNYIVSSSILSPSVLEVLNGRRAGDEYVLSMEGRNNKRPQHAINHRYLCKWNIDVYVNKQRLYGQNKMYRQWVALQAKVKPVYWIAVDLFTSASIYLYRDMCSIFIHVNNRLVLQAVFAKNFVHTVWKPTHTPLRKYHKIINWMKTKGKICVSTQILMRISRKMFWAI